MSVNIGTQSRPWSNLGPTLDLRPGFKIEDALEAWTAKTTALRRYRTIIDLIRDWEEAKAREEQERRLRIYAELEITRETAAPERTRHEGLAVELSMSRLTGWPTNWEQCRDGQGDTGMDFWHVDERTIDLKSARRPKYLVLPIERHWSPRYTPANVFVLVSLEFYPVIEYLGWETREKLLAADVVDFKRGILNHAIDVRETRWMDELHLPLLALRR